jgi:Fur family ferric uptake transcriptional regulator
MAEVDIADILREKGQRLTPQRLMILTTLVEPGGHMTAEAIHERVRHTYPYVNLSTVYRTLEMLRDQGIVSETDLGGGTRQFELMKQRHHHLICLTCGRMQDLDHALFVPLHDHLRATFDFEARIDHLAIFGTCRECRKREATHA